MNKERFEKIHPKPVVLAIGNRKGGTGKSTVSLNLAYTYSQMGFKTLLIDADPQQSATNLLGYNRTMKNDPEISINEIGVRSMEAREDNLKPYELDDLFGTITQFELMDSDYKGQHDLITNVREGIPLSKDVIKDAILRPAYKADSIKVREFKKRNTLKDLQNVDTLYIPFGFDLLPSSEEISDDELAIAATSSDVRKPFILKTIVNAIKKYALYEIIIIDCPPSLGIMTINAFAAADGIILVANADEQSIFSLSKIKKNIREIMSYNNDQCNILGVILNMVMARSNMVHIVENKIRRTLNLYTFKNKIPYSGDAAKANTDGRLFSQINQRVNAAFKKLAEEILIRFLNNEDWINERSIKVDTEYNRIINDEDLYLKIKNDSLKEIQKAYSENGQNIEDIPKDRLNIAIRKVSENKIFKLIKIEYSEGKLWKPINNEYGKYKQKEEQ